MKSTFFYKEHPKHVQELTIEADLVQFEDGWVVFYEKANTKQWPFTEKRIIQALHKEACHNVREIVNQ